MVLILLPVQETVIDEDITISPTLVTNAVMLGVNAPDSVASVPAVLEMVVLRLITASKLSDPGILLVVKLGLNVNAVEQDNENVLVCVLETNLILSPDVLSVVCAD